MFFDLETGGLLPEHPIIQIGAVAVRSGKIVERFEAKLYFDASQADHEALSMNSYSPEEWEADAVFPRAALEMFASFCRRHATIERISERTGRKYAIARLAGHNVARFDCERLVAAFKAHGLFLPADAFRPLDTLQLALWHFATGAHHAPASARLGDVAAALGIEVRASHDALEDARTSFEIARSILARMHSMEVPA